MARKLSDKEVIGIGKSSKASVYHILKKEGQPICDSRMAKGEVDKEKTIADVLCAVCKRTSYYKRKMEDITNPKPPDTIPILPKEQKTEAVKKADPPKKVPLKTAIPKPKEPIIPIIEEKKAEVLDPIIEEDKKVEKEINTGKGISLAKIDEPKMLVIDKAQEWKPKPVFCHWGFHLKKSTMLASITHIGSGTVFFENLNPIVGAVATTNLNEEMETFWAGHGKMPKNFISKAKKQVTLAYESLGINPSETVSKKNTRKIKRRKKTTETLPYKMKKRRIKRREKPEELLDNNEKIKIIKRAINKVSSIKSRQNFLLKTIFKNGPISYLDLIEELENERGLGDEIGEHLIEDAINKARESQEFCVILFLSSEKEYDLYKILPI